MKTISVLVTRSVQPPRPASLEPLSLEDGFWAGVAGESLKVPDEPPARLRARMETRLRNEFPFFLQAAMHAGEMASEKTSPKVFGKPSGSRLVVVVQNLRYGSLTMDLGIPDLDAFFSLVGKNTELLAAVFACYVPTAFARATGLPPDEFSFQVLVPQDVTDALANAGAESEKAGRTVTQKMTDAAKGAFLVSEMLKSAIVLPLLVLCFLWFYARQDALADKTLVYNLVGTLAAQQTAVLTLLKGKETPAPERAVTDCCCLTPLPVVCLPSQKVVPAKAPLRNFLSFRLL